MVKFADDTNIIIPAVNANSRQSELINVESWSRVNNLRVNPTKYAKIVYMDKRLKTTVQLPQPMPNVARVSVIKILGMTFTDQSVSRRACADSNKLQCTNSVCVENCAHMAWTTQRFRRFFGLSS